MNRYLNVVNTAEAPALIAKGNDRVLRARLADAQFFVGEDEKQPLEARLPKLDTVTFHAKLGTVGQKIGRVARIARRLAEDVGVDPELAERAATLAKADLETLIVFEFPDLQGLMGRHYALKEGLPAELADALRDHYKPSGGEDDPPEAALSAVVGVADRVDTLVGCFGVGLEPKGSNDPFALRRAALGIVRTILEGPVDVSLTRLVDLAAAELQDVASFDDASIEGQRRVLEFVRARLRALFRERFRGDVVDAAIAAWWEQGSVDLDGGLSPRDLAERLRALEAFRARPEFDDLATAFKRAYNIAKDAPRGAVDAALLEAGAETELAEAFAASEPSIRAALEARDYTAAFETVAGRLKAPIDRFFEEVFVMVDEAAVRANRLRLLAQIADTVSAAAHLHVLAPA
ncbi:MAG: glycine--tRNA ligase subunit beta, partial [Myxococcota bacterium]